MRQWAQKPANPKLFSDKEIPFAFTMSGLKSDKEFLTNIKKQFTTDFQKQKL